MKRRHFLHGASALVASTVTAGAQNIATPGALGPVKPKLTLTHDHVERLLEHRWSPPPPSEAACRHVAELCAGHRWRPFHQVLGISGHETHFDHPDEFFAALALVGPEGDAKLPSLLADEARRFPPWAVEGWAWREGKPRERYDVPASLVPDRRGRARDLFGLHAAWLWSTRFDVALSSEQWMQLTVRLAEASDLSDPQCLNGAIAGHVAAIRLARARGDATVEKAARTALLPLLQARIDLERTDPQVWTPHSRSSKQLHSGSLARWLHLTPELGFALREFTDGAAAARVTAACRKWPAWWIVGGERLVGGENFIAPLHFSRALWQAVAWISPAPKDLPQPTADVPACAADLAFLESTALAPRR